MSNQTSQNQLPEVDSLPDGFIEPSPPRTPTLYQDRLRPELDSSTDSKQESPDADSGVEIKPVEKFDKLRTFPVPLSGFDDVTGSAGDENNGVVAGVSMPVSSYDEPATATGTGGSEQQATSIKEKATTESAEFSKTRKLETSEVKRKTAKRSFKSEKEFLEFTLKYQQVIAERDAAVAIRDKLESLCRELQRQNKILMDECKKVSTEGQSMRLDLSTRFHDAIKDVTHKLEEQKDESLNQLKENDMLRNKLKHLADQYAVSEQQFTQKLKQKSLELQLAELKIQQHQEKLTQEQSQMKLYAEQVSQLLTTEKNLRSQLAADGEKFQQFQDALLKSNEVFETFKQEIEKMAKSIKELKKENVFLKGKCEKSDYTLIELVEEREHMKKQMEKLKNQKEKLESLCRSLQAERKQVSAGTNASDHVSL